MSTKQKPQKKKEQNLSSDESTAEPVADNSQAQTPAPTDEPPKPKKKTTQTAHKKDDDAASKSAAKTDKPTVSIIHTYFVLSHTIRMVQTQMLNMMHMMTMLLMKLNKDSQAQLNPSPLLPVARSQHLKWQSPK